MLPNRLIALLLNITEGLSERLVEALVRANVLHAKCFWYRWQTLKLDNSAVFAYLLHLFAILDVDVSGGVLLVVLNGEAVTWWRCTPCCAQW